MKYFCILGLIFACNNAFAGLIYGTSNAQNVGRCTHSNYDSITHNNTTYEYNGIENGIHKSLHEGSDLTQLQLKNKSQCTNFFNDGAITHRIADAASSIFIDGKSGLAKLGAFGSIASSGTVGASASSVVDVGFSFLQPINKPLVMDLFLNADGWFRSSGVGYASFQQNLRVRSTGVIPRYNSFDFIWYSHERDYVSELNKIEVELAKGTRDVHLRFQSSVSAGAQNGRLDNHNFAEAHFYNTSWLNYSFSEQVEFSVDLPGFLSSPKDNIVMASEPKSVWLWCLLFLAFHF